MLEDTRKRTGAEPAYAALSHYGRADSTLTVFTYPSDGELINHNLMYDTASGAFLREKPSLGLVPSIGGASADLMVLCTSAISPAFCRRACGSRWGSRRASSSSADCCSGRRVARRAPAGAAWNAWSRGWALGSRCAWRQCRTEYLRARECRYRTRASHGPRVAHHRDCGSALQRSPCVIQPASTLAVARVRARACGASRCPPPRRGPGLEDALNNGLFTVVALDIAFVVGGLLCLRAVLRKPHAVPLRDQPETSSRRRRRANALMGRARGCRHNSAAVAAGVARS